MKPVRLSAAAAFLQGMPEMRGGVPDFEITGFAPVDAAGPSDISFWKDKAVNGGARLSKTGVLLVTRDFKGFPEGVRSLLRVEDPYHAMVCFVREYHESSETFGKGTVAPSARVHPTACVEGSVGENSVVGPFCVIPRGACVGAECNLEAHVTLYPRVRIGDRCTAQAGAVFGSRGFGYYTYRGKMLPVPHFGGVVIGDDCSFGANTVVAAGTFAPTRVGNDSHVDSFVQIAHNCVLGISVYMAAQCGLAGGTVVEDFVEMGGGVQSAGHLTVGKGARICARAGLIKSVPPGAMVAGFPAVPVGDWRRQELALRKLGTRLTK